MQTDDIPGWFDFSHYYDSIVERLKALGRPVRLLEIGVFQGASSCYLAEAIKRAGLVAELHCCDLFRTDGQYQVDGLAERESTRHLFEANLTQRGLRDVVTIHEGPSEEILARFADYSLDFVFVDGSHVFRDVVRDIELSLKKLRPDGILAGHDIDLPDVQKALAKYGLRYERFGGVWELRGKVGIVYVAWGEHGINEAERAAWWGKLPTCLITDTESRVNENVFGQVIRTDFREFAELHHFYRKMMAFRLTPFDVTMYSDADTYPIGDLSLGFQLARRHRFAAVIAPGQTFVWKDREFVHYNCGVLFFSGDTRRFENAVLARAGEFPDCDEPAWALAWDQLGIVPATLPPVFNLVSAGRIHDRAIRLWHSRHPLQTVCTSQTN